MKCKNCVRHVHLNDDGERTVGTPNWCFYLSDSPDEELERDCIAFKSLTNSDRIRSCTDEELAEFVSGVEAEAIRRAGLFITTGDIKRGKDGWLDWLEQEAVSDG